MSKDEELLETAAWLAGHDPAAEDWSRWREEQPGRLEPAGELGRGGMGTVERCLDTALYRRVARKLIRAELAEDLPTLQMFVREARLAARLAHPSIVPVYDVGRAPDGRPFFTMQELHGRPLSEVLADPPSPLADGARLFDLLGIVTRVCDAVAFAHEKGVLHGDIKPANVMVCDFGAVYLVDWGIARVFSDFDAAAGTAIPAELHDTAVLGSPPYMSPEQARGERDRMGPASDVFSLGALLFEVLAGRPPYVADGMDQLLELARRGRPPRLCDVVGHLRVPPGLDKIVVRALATAPADRHPSAGALREELVAFMRGGELPSRRFAAGEVIVHEGEPGAAAFVIDSGLCEASRVIDGRRVSLRRMGPGEVFGEMAILHDEARSATVTALEDTVVREVTAALLEQELDALKPWMSALLRSIAERFRQLERTSLVPPST